MHLHSNCSDGSDPPARVVERAAALDFSAVALCDHDSVSGLEEGAAAAEQHGIEFLPATEISAHLDGLDLHVIGLGVQATAPRLCEALQQLKQSRVDRAKKMVELLNHFNVPVTNEQVHLRAKGGAIGRLHIAQEIHHHGHADSVQQAFDKFIGRGNKAYVPKFTLHCTEAIDVIHHAGGLAILAHPGIGAMPRYLQRLMTLPFDGLEAYHTKHSPEQTAQFIQLATQHNLLISGGSDCHGTIKGLPAEMGRVRMPYKHYQHIKTALEHTT